MKIRIMLLALLLCFSGIITPLFSDDKVTVAVLDLTAKGVPQIIANAISDIIRSEFVNIGNFTVVERSQMKSIMDEQGLQMTGCTDSACAVQLGKILSARRIVIGEVNKIGEKFVITARYVDVNSGESIFSSTDKSSTLDEVDAATQRLAKDLATRIVSGDKEVITPRTVKGFYIRSIVPGWGQFYANNTIRGYIFSSLFGLSCIASGYFVYDFYQKKSDYNDLPKGTPAADFKKARDDYDNAALMANISFGVIGAVYLVHWIDILFFSRNDFQSLIASEDSGTVFIGNSDYLANANEMNFIFGYKIRF